MFRFVKHSFLSLRLCDAIFDGLYKQNRVVSKITFCPNSICKNINIKCYSNSTTTTISVQSEESFDTPNINEIAGGDPDLQHKLRILILETDVLRQDGHAVPDVSHIKPEHWKELLTLSSKSGRKKYLEFLFKVAKKKESALKKKIENRLIRAQTEIPAKDYKNVHDYTLGCNHFLLRIYDSTIMQMYNNILIQAMQFGQKLVIDCGYCDHMTKRENTNCAKQLMLLFADNRYSNDPFDLHFCNVTTNSDLMQHLKKLIPTIHEEHFPLHIHEKSYLDIFPKEKLVYLTPNCRDILTEYDHDAIYIIGGLVDKTNSEPLSLAKAKKEGLKMAKLPLDLYLEWGAGSGKSLTINQVLSILVDVKHSGDWKQALKHVPRRKLAEYSEHMAKQKFERNLYGMKTQNASSWKPQTQMNNLKYGETRISKKTTKNLKEWLDLKNN